MQYDVGSPEEYLEVIDDDWRKEKLLEIREMILTADPDLIEAIQYKMLSYGDGNSVVCHLNAQKHFVGLYVGNAEKIDPDGSLLKGINRGKGCLRISKSLNLQETNLAAFIQRTIALWRDGIDIAC